MQQHGVKITLIKGLLLYYNVQINHWAIIFRDPIWRNDHPKLTFVFPKVHTCGPASCHCQATSYKIDLKTFDRGPKDKCLKMHCYMLQSLKQYYSCFTEVSYIWFPINISFIEGKFIRICYKILTRQLNQNYTIFTDGWSCKYKRNMLTIIKLMMKIFVQCTGSSLNILQ